MAEQATQILKKIRCPHCWEEFQAEDTLYISQHPELLGDPRLGPNAAMRFLPQRFRLDGAAIDPKEFPSTLLACPHCHLPIPRPLFEMPTVFFSMVGAPGSGKSYFLAAMTWKLRQILPQLFHVSFTDADPLVNQQLQNYESLQFLNADPNAVVKLGKTELAGDPYDAVLYGTQTVWYLKPYLFTLTPDRFHPFASRASMISRTLCLYDNAGEHFQPGTDGGATPVTRHLALAKVIFFLFDPTQDIRFRQELDRMGQNQERTDQPSLDDNVRQDTLFVEAVKRLRQYAGLGQHERLSAKVIVVVTKYDVWAPLCPALKKIPSQVWRYVPILGTETRLKKLEKLAADGNVPGNAVVRSNLIRSISSEVKTMLRRLSPEFLTAIQATAENVVFLPVSATGCSMTTDSTGKQGFRPADLKPQWAEVPMLYAMATQLDGFLSRTRERSE